ncbi:MAG: hypothetical protein H6732_11125 [Alphaproteobacteria bacterium]|nr:hypothetical protein [Alphaproteobacteria bacterium]
MSSEGGRIPGWVASLLALGLGILLVLGVAEAGFRVAELFLDRSGPGEAAARTILAEGDSFTYGIGGLSYPQQLEEVLEARLGDRRYRAINRGIPGLNTAALADMLEEDLLAFDPDVVVVLIGENDSWNTIRTPEVGGWWHAVDRTLMHSRVYKFVRVAVIGWRFNTFHEADAAAQASRAAGEVVAQERPPHHVADDAERLGLFGTLTGEIHPETVPTPVVGAEGEAALRAIIPLSEQGRYAEVIEQTEAYLERWPEEPLAYETLAAAMARLDRLDEAAAVLRRGLADTAPSAMHENLWFVLGSVLHRAGRDEEAMAAWTQALTDFPRSKALFWSMSHALYQQGRPFAALDLAERVPALRDNELYRYLLDVKAQHPGTGGDVSAQVVEAMRGDLRRIVALAEAHGAALVFASYPDMAYPVVAEVAAESGTPYVDFRPYFQERFSSREEYISPDRCHCNTDGYRLMAEVLADTVLQLDGAPRHTVP